MKWWAGAAGVVLAMAAVVGTVAAVVRFGDGPLGPFPGGELVGERVASPVEDWRFLDDVDRVELQVHARHPRSITVWVVREGEALYVPAAYASRKRWPAQTVSDGRVVLRHEGRLYELHARLVDDPALRQALSDAVNLKYGPRDADGEPVGKAEFAVAEASKPPPDDYWYFRLDPR